MRKEILRSFSTHRDGLPLNITLAGITYPHPEYRVDRPLSSITVLEYVMSGEGIIEFDGKEKRVGAGQIYLLRRGVPHHYRAVKADPYKKIFMNISGALCDTILDAYGLGAGIYEDPGVKRAFEEIPQFISIADDAEARCALQGIFLHVIASLSLAKGKPEADPEADAMKKYLDSHFDRTVSAEELSGVIFRSPDYCRKAFFRAFGTTPYAYQLEQRICRAKTLLSQTGLPVGEIACMLGYEDPHYFSNLFYSKTGIRPLAYRKTKC